MNEHATWFDFLDGWPAFRGLKHVLEVQLGRGESSTRPWTFAMFDGTYFSLAHVLGMLLVAVFVVTGAMVYKRSLRGPTHGVVPPAKLNLRNFLEMFTDAVFNLATGVMGKKNAKRFLPLIGSLALLIFFCNFIALIPGFAPPTDTLKTNLALSGVVFLATHYYGVKEHGVSYFKHFFGPIWWLAPIMLPIELISHIARPASVALRLMGNMASDHKVVAAFFALVPLLVPVPFLILGLLVVIVQTLVFCLLSMVYISMAIAHDH